VKEDSKVRPKGMQNAMQRKWSSMTDTDIHLSASSIARHIGCDLAMKLFLLPIDSFSCPSLLREDEETKRSSENVQE
jgi:hypothetical protein